MRTLQFDFISELAPGEKLSQLFHRTWPAYRAWYLDEGEAARPSYLECLNALKEYMPELLPVYQQLSVLLGCDDLQARFLSLYCPPTFYSACSQLIYKKERTALIRNYDFPAFLCEGTILQSQWLDKKVIATADCLWGALDGMNDSGLSVSINYGGRLVEGKGFGITIVIRYILETCSTVDEAIDVLKRVPVHLDYNIALLDKQGQHATVFIAPDRDTCITLATTSTNHQGAPEPGKPLLLDDTLIRLDALNLLAAPRESNLTDTVGHFLRPPLYRPHDIYTSGTLYTAVYLPTEGIVSFVWPHHSVDLSFEQFPEQILDIRYL
ncbi:C45 family autoproteolytic acyltransferase/hydolase [Amphritea sp.]|uniref:C45 family autoproteolytic acyltransferase/hydolase n=1 Tax=Amphritea sp. TaxID=1872502 RepID=UPI003A8D03F7